MFSLSRLLGAEFSFQVLFGKDRAERGEERGRRSCYQSAAPGPKTDRTETSVQHRVRHSPKTNFPQRHWIVLVSSAVKGHCDSPDSLSFWLNSSFFLFFSSSCISPCTSCFVSSTWFLVFNFFLYLLYFCSFLFVFLLERLYDCTENGLICLKGTFLQYLLCCPLERWAILQANL